MDPLFLNKEVIRILDPWQEDIISGGMIILGIILCVSGEIWFNTLVAVIAAIAGGMAMNLFLVKYEGTLRLLGSYTAVLR
jgi:hypothetical protein